jgi:hypothetical protein
MTSSESSKTSFPHYLYTDANRDLKIPGEENHGCQGNSV